MVLQQPQEIEASEDTQHLNAIYDGIKAYKRRIAELEAALAEETNLRKKAQAQSAALHQELVELRSGKGVILNIQGRHFRMTEDIQSMETSVLTGSGSNGHAKSPLADSFVL